MLVRLVTTGFGVENISERRCEVCIASFSFVPILPFISSFSSLLPTTILVLYLFLISPIRIISFPTFADLFLFVLLSYCIHMFQPELEADRPSSSNIEVKTVCRHSVREDNFAFTQLFQISNLSDTPALS